MNQLNQSVSQSVSQSNQIQSHKNSKKNYFQKSFIPPSHLLLLIIEQVFRIITDSILKVTVQSETERNGQNEIVSHMDRLEVKL